MATRARAWAAACALLLATCAPPHPPAGPQRKTVRSNILRVDYAGSATCATCHADLYRAYMGSAMHNMTRVADTARIRAPFAGTFRFKGESVALEVADGHHWMRVDTPGVASHRYRVTKVIGGNHREDFAGVESGGDSLTERILPVSYLIGSGRFRYKGYSVMTPERPGLRPGAEWRATCIFCHNTVPLFSQLLGEWGGPSAPSYQGESVNRLIPKEARWHPRITDNAAFRNALTDEISYLKAAAPAPAASEEHVLRAATVATRERFGEAQLAELGIGCEACHGGSREHVLDPTVHTSLDPTGPFIAMDRKEKDPRQIHDGQVIRACARCHQVLFSGYPWTWEGGRRSDAVPGGAHINSGEGRDMLLGKCRIACTACHDPHAHDHSADAARLEGPAGNAICLQCHGALAAPEALRAHARHDPQGPGGSCLNCHMPRKNMSLDTRLSRYHRIGSPTDPAKVEGDRPLECALCHGDKTVRSLVDTMESWWPHRYDRRALAKLYGDLDSNALAATLRLGKPHEQAVALYLAGSARRKDLAQAAVDQLGNPRPLVRYYADQALESILDQKSPLDLHQDDAALRSAAEAWLKSAARD